MKKFLFLVLLLLVASAVLLTNESIRYTVEPAFYQVDRHLSGYERVLTRHDNRGAWLSRNDFKDFSRQRRAASEHGTPLMESEAILNQAIEGGALVRLPVRGKGYRIMSEQLTESIPYFTPQTVESFASLCKTFSENMQQAGFDDGRLSVCSGTRTTSNQLEVAKENSGATSGISPHSYGAALDLYAVEFTGKHGREAHREALDVLKATLKSSKRFYWVLEKSNLHLTVKTD